MTEYIERDSALNLSFVARIGDSYEKIIWAERINDIPAADVEPVRRGRWRNVYMISKNNVSQICSCCNNTIVMDRGHHFNYCPACGAKMDLQED